jgi:pyruvate formate lyase activating enzyme
VRKGITGKKVPGGGKQSVKGTAPAPAPGLKKAMFQTSLEDGKVRCGLCHHNCALAKGKPGICRVRKNKGGKLYTTIYSLATAVNVDPIEKKPFFHFHPGAPILSFGTKGCNFRCSYCQNFNISQKVDGLKGLKSIGPPDKPADMAREMGCKAIAWTYNEPTIWYEYIYDSSKVAKRKGLLVTFVSNGYIREAPLRNLAPYLDAINIDIKGFNAGEYKKTSGADMGKVMETCKLILELDLHLEISYLVIPTYNDSAEEVSRFSRWVVEELSPDVPVHCLRLHPDYQWVHLPQTQLPTMLQAYQTALKEGLNYPYLGNIPNEGYEDTRCFECDAAVIKRRGHAVLENNLKKGQCPECGAKLPIVH